MRSSNAKSLSHIQSSLFHWGAFFGKHSGVFSTYTAVAFIIRLLYLQERSSSSQADVPFILTHTGSASIIQRYGSLCKKESLQALHVTVYGADDNHSWCMWCNNVNISTHEAAQQVYSSHGNIETASFCTFCLCFHWTLGCFEVKQLDKQWRQL